MSGTSLRPKFLSVVFILLSSSEFTNVNGFQDVKIVGGTPADISSVPFLLSLRYYSTHFCAANAISPVWSVTAAHCLHNYPPKNSVCLLIIYLP